ncbi:MAG TPA: hypothetical protein VF702_14705 [Allosphingosinicella sp.]|jgi:hypothetical protein
MSSPWNGIYNAYMTGAEGQGFAMLVFLDGVIAGSDAQGTLFDGTYEEDAEGMLTGVVRTTVSGGESVIQGTTAGPAGLFYDVAIQVKLADLAADFIQIPTPLGPVNVKLEKIRPLGEQQ